MKEQEQQERLIIPSAAWFVSAVLACVFLFAGIGVWQEYRDTLMKNQKEQLLILTETLGASMEVSLAEYADTLDFLAQTDAMREPDEDFYESYLNAQSGFICDVFWEEETGRITESIRDTELKNFILYTEIDAQTGIWKAEDPQGTYYLVLKKALPEGGALGLVIDSEKYYQELISGIQVGSNGYIVIKNSQGTLIMHPEKEQWGIGVISGRQELYPQLDLDSLERMVEQQLDGKTGISEYYSYWWTDTEVPRVKKISAYVPVPVGQDFWVASTVIDYDDFYIPIKEGFSRILMVFLGLFLLFAALACYIGKLLLERKKASEEISYLREWNALLEEVQRSEESIAHQQRLQIMGTMTGGIAHEFNNFLTPIMGYAELLMLELPEDSDAFDSAQEIYEASEKAKDVVRQISSLSRKNVETVYQAISVEKQISRAVKMVESVCPAQVHLEKEIHLAGEKILGNSTQINQVILNIFMNAIHAVGKKNGVIRIGCRVVTKEAFSPEELTKVSDVFERYVQIDIADNGCGMDKDTLRQIFNPFFTTKKNGEGTGLGLSLAEQIVRSHRGHLYAESTPGEGSVFHILLPVLEDMAEPAVLKRRDKRDLNILIADDNAKVLQLLQKSFHALGVEVQTGRSQKETRELLEQGEVDVLFIDESLEDGSGIDFCMVIGQRYPGMLRILMADFVTREIVEAKQKKLIHGYVEKPVSDASLLEAIRLCAKESPQTGMI